jgi:hypothetical protein
VAALYDLGGEMIDRHCGSRRSLLVCPMVAMK